MESWLMAVDHIGRHARSWCYIQGSTSNHEKEGKRNNLGWILYSVYAVHGVCLYSVYAVHGVCLYSVYAVHCVCLYSVYAVLGVCCTQYMLYSVYAVLGVCCTWCMLYSVYAIRVVCYTRCMLYLLYAILGVKSWSWHGETERDDSTLCPAMMVGLWTRKREQRDEDGNDVEDTSWFEKSGVRLTWLAWEELLSVLLNTGSCLVSAVTGMVNWLAHQMLFGPSFSWWCPLSPLISLFHILNSTIT